MDEATQQRLIARIRELLRRNATDLAEASSRVAAGFRGLISRRSELM